ncbi:MAG: hypothetical protein ACI3W5_16570, partial [Faecousia sp.]
GERLFQTIIGGFCFFLPAKSISQSHAAADRVCCRALLTQIMRFVSTAGKHRLFVFLKQYGLYWLAMR